MMISTVFYWLLASLILLIFELSTPGHFYFLSFSCGCLLAALLGWLGFSLFSQSFTAVIITIVVFAALYYWVKKGAQMHKDSRSNYEALIGKEGIITKPVEQKIFGHVKINGETWSCRSVHDELMPIQTRVRVMRVSGAHVIVEKIVER